MSSPVIAKMEKFQSKLSKEFFDSCHQQSGSIEMLVLGELHTSWFQLLLELFQNPV